MKVLAPTKFNYEQSTTTSLNNYAHMQGAIQLLRARMQYFAETIYTVPMLSKHTPCRCETQPVFMGFFTVFT